MQLDSLIDMTIRDFSNLLASSEPAPGGAPACEPVRARSTMMVGIFPLIRNL